MTVICNLVVRDNNSSFVVVVCSSFGEMPKSLAESHRLEACEINFKKD